MKTGFHPSRVVFPSLQPLGATQGFTVLDHVPDVPKPSPPIPPEIPPDVEEPEFPDIPPPPVQDPPPQPQPIVACML